MSPDPAPSAAPFLVVGLGNPGEEYDRTPHNFGFQLVDELARRSGARLKMRECQALTGRALLAGKPIWLAQPQTFMNLSGTSIRQLLAKQPVAGWLVACDELDLPFGTIRLRERGSAGSHNGLRSIVDSLGTTEFARMRLGIAPDHPLADRVGFVLGKWSAKQCQTAEQTVATAADAVELILTGGMAQAMNRYNTDSKSSLQE